MEGIPHEILAAHYGEEGSTPYKSVVPLITFFGVCLYACLYTNMCQLRFHS